MEWARQHRRNFFNEFSNQARVAGWCDRSQGSVIAIEAAWRAFMLIDSGYELESKKLDRQQFAKSLKCGRRLSTNRVHLSFAELQVCAMKE
jgi:hypothetical protein